MSQVERDETIKEINNLKTNKATQITDITTKLIKENSDVFGDFISENFNSSVFYSIFPSPMKNAIITAVCKKCSKTSKDNYSPVNISNTSRIHERLIFKQISEDFEPICKNVSMWFQ